MGAQHPVVLTTGRIDLSSGSERVSEHVAHLGLGRGRGIATALLASPRRLEKETSLEVPDGFLASISLHQGVPERQFESGSPLSVSRGLDGFQAGRSSADHGVPATRCVGPERRRNRSGSGNQLTALTKTSEGKCPDAASDKGDKNCDGYTHDGGP